MATSMWMVRSPRGEHAHELAEKGLIGIGWGEAGPALLSAKTPDDFYAIVKMHWPDYKAQQVINAGRQLYKFFREIKTGDDVLTYDSAQRLYMIGTVVGEAKSNPKLIANLSNFRAVEWKNKFGRDSLSLDTRNSLGSTLTLFKPSDEAIIEIRQVSGDSASHTAPRDQPDTTETGAVYDDAYERSRELIKDKMMSLNWSDMQHVVAGVLRAMGYKTKVSPEGSDRGKDIVASPDGLGLEQPRIFVEVKHRKGAMGAPEIRKFIGGRDHQNDKCLYVSTGGFTTEGKYEAERSKIPLTLIDSDDLVELLVENYERADAELKALMPLRKTYWPARL